MKTYLLLLILLPCGVFSQLQIGLTGTINQSFRTLKTAPTTGVQWIIDLRDKSEKSITSFNSGMVLNHRFRNGIILESGVEYQQYGYETANVMAINAQGNQTGIITTKELFDYFSLPLRSGYSFEIGEHFRLGGIIGANLNIFFKRTFKHDISYEDGSHDKGESTYYENTGYSRFLIMANAGIQVDYLINKHFTLRLEPVGHYAITPDADAPIEERPYSLGIGVGMFYKFGRKE